ncbi:MAG: alpha,alpha-trehalose phosphorylase [Actinomycetota bacterium]|nr:alpha,alpha-trehalose phosphorylase [Actinomycetota bacterium]
MITEPAYVVEPWCVRETELHLDLLSQGESVFALSNGHIGLRGNLDEGEPFGVPGTYLNGVYELRPLPYAEAGYGYPESGQSVINVTNGKILRLLVDDEPFDVRYGVVRSHERALDLRAGTLTRRVEWVSPAGQAVRVTSERLVSLTQRAVVAINYTVEAVGAPARVVVQSELVANEAAPVRAGDPRVADAIDSPLATEDHTADGPKVLLLHRTRASGIRVAAGMTHVVEGPAVGLDVESESFPDIGRVSVTTILQPGQRLRIVKFVAYGWSGLRSIPALRDQVAAALLAARQAGWDGLVADQRAYLDDFWARADVEVDGDPAVQQAVRFALFQVLQAGARAERRAIPAKGLTGPGYDGHSFWDMEIFVLPLLTYTVPRAVADALAWRRDTMARAEERAAQLGLKGAAFPWRTIAGEECSAYWPAGTAGFHVNADIAAAVIRYVDATDDREFERTVGLQLLVGTARLWRSLGHHDYQGRFRIDGVTGPDEYSAVADNNVYTNLMAEQNLLAAADAATRHPDEARALGVDDEESASWRDAAAAMVVPYDAVLGVHPQAEGFTDHQVWDFDATPPDHYPLFLHHAYFDLYRKQVVKQADLVLALHLRGDAFTPEEKARDFDYYERLTVRDSSLSACTQAVMAAEVGHLGLAFEYLRETALIDLQDLGNNTRDGLHLAALAGTWSAVVCGFGGLRDHGGRLCFAPRLPEQLSRIAFGLAVRGRRLRVEITPTRATYVLLEGEPLEVAHHGQVVLVSTGLPVARPVPALVARSRPSQPHGREPGCIRRVEPTGDEGLQAG